MRLPVRKSAHARGARCVRHPWLFGAFVLAAFGCTSNRPAPQYPYYTGQPGYGPPPGYAPQGYAPQGYAPQGYAPQGYAPQGYAPRQPQPPRTAQTFVGATVRGSLAPSDLPIDGGGFGDDYQIRLTAGQPITISLRGGRSLSNPGQILDVYLILLYNGRELAHDDDGGGYPHSQLVFTPPVTGDYTIRVTSFGRRQEGDYELTVRAGTPRVAPMLQIGAFAVGRLENGDDINSLGALMDDYTLLLTANEPVTIVVRGGPSATDANTTLDMFAVLLRDGQLVAYDNNSAGHLNSRIVFTPQSSGRYTLRVTTFGAGRRQGNYMVQTWAGAVPSAY